MKMQRRELSKAAGGRPGTLMENLEPRQLMTAALSWVGADFSANGNSVMLGDAVLADDSTVTGTQLFATPAGVQGGQAADAVAMSFGAGGAMSITRGNGFAPFVSQTGTDFRLAAGGFVLGTHSGIYDAGGSAGQSIRVIVERRNDFSSYLKTGRIVVRLTKITASGIEYRQIGLDVGATTVTEYQNPLMIGDEGVVKTITSKSADGVVSFGNGEKLIFARRASDTGSEQVAVYFDGDSSDGNVGYGLGVMKSSYAQYAVPNALVRDVVYRGWIATPNPTAKALLAVPEDSGYQGQDVAIVLSYATGNFSVYHAEDYGVTGSSAVWTGTWTTTRYSELYSTVASPSNYREQFQYLANQLCLVGADGQELVFLRSSAYTLSPAMYRTTASEFRFLIGGALTTKVFARPPAIVGLNLQSADIDGQGNPVVYGVSQTDGQEWHKRDLAALTSGKPLRAGVVSKPGVGSAVDDWTWLGVATDGNVVTYHMRNVLSDFAGVVFDDVSQRGQTVLGGLVFAGSVQVFAGSGTAIGYIAGRTVENAFVLVRLGRKPDSSEYEWSIQDLGAQLAQGGQSLPEWVGPISGYETPWGSVAVAGFNASGQMEAVWTAPEAPGWRRANLSVISGAPAMGGAISTQTTSWQGINMAARTLDGDLAVVWWAPDLQGAWRYSNLTVQTATPKLQREDFRGRPATMTGWQFGDNLNFAAIGVDGLARVYWWSENADTWKITIVNPPFDPLNQPASLVPDVRDFVRSGKHQFFAINSNSDLLRVYWQGSPKDEWIIENVGAGAI